MPQVPRDGVHKAHTCETVRDQDGALTCSLAGIFAVVYNKLVPVSMIASGMTGDGKAPGSFL
jgi:hypothetical protein